MKWVKYNIHKKQAYIQDFILTCNINFILKSHKENKTKTSVPNIDMSTNLY